MRFFLYFLIISIVVFGCSCEGKRVERTFRSAEKLWEKGEYQEAIRGWEIILSEAPQSEWADDALHLIGTTYYLNLSDTDRAISAFRRLIKDYQDSIYAPRAQLTIAEIYQYQRGDYLKAAEEYYRFLKLFPTSPERDRVSLWLVLSLFESHNYEQARTIARELFENFPHSKWRDDALYWISECFYVEGKPDEAQKWQEEYIKLYPEGEFIIQAKFGRAKSLEAQDRLLEAISAYEELLEIYPNRSIIENRLNSVKERYQQKQAIISPK